MGACGKVCTGLHVFILGLAATLYLILGLVIIAASAATFFTSYGEIFTPIYAGSSIGVGCGILLVSIFGYCAACRAGKLWRCWLGVFMLFDILIVAIIAGVSVLMFRYEDILSAASGVGAGDQVESALSSLKGVEVTAIKHVVVNAFTACNGTTIMNTTTAPAHFDFSCFNSEFDTLGTIVDQCVATSAVAAYNTSFYNCYEASEAIWPSNPDLTPGFGAAELLPVLQTPKGLYCACSSKVMEDFILKYFGVTKWVAIGVAVFFLLIFVSCCYVCCTKKEDTAVKNKDIQLNYGWSAGGGQNSSIGYGPASGKARTAKSGRPQQDGAFLSRP